MLSRILWAAAAGLLTSLGLIAGVREWTRRGALLDHPNDRSLHTRPTPRGGGIGIVVPVLLCLVVLTAMDAAGRTSIAWIAAAGLVVAAVGLIDDLRGLPALTRLTTQVFGAMVMTAALGHWRVFVWPGLWVLDLGWTGFPLTVILVVGLTNAYNFMDGIDGIAGTQGVVAGLGWAGVGYTVQDPCVATTGAVLATASLGFLIFNWPPASIFMGDVGSSFLGFILAALVVLVAPRSPAIALAGVLFVWPFVFDTTLTLLRRVSRGENLFSAHRTHLYQRLVLSGVPHRTVTLAYGALAIVGVATGNAIVREATTVSLAGALLICVLAAGLWMAVIFREQAARAGAEDGASRGASGDPGFRKG
jgi:UDP-N-acetylmuramyl pentapeptide phosphotransferase/UDP-N-acetylglucosamine-1-phosphate transferase